MSMVRQLRRDPELLTAITVLVLYRQPAKIEMMLAAVDILVGNDCHDIGDHGYQDTVVINGCRQLALSCQLLFALLL